MFLSHFQKLTEFLKTVKSSMDTLLIEGLNGRIKWSFLNKFFALRRGISCVFEAVGALISTQIGLSLTFCYSLPVLLQTELEAGFPAACKNEHFLE